MTIPFTKAQAVGNDFLIVAWDALARLGVEESALPELARGMCDRRRGIGADGLEVLYAPETDDALASLRLFNSDGSEAEISGNGTRCVAAFLVAEERAAGVLSIGTKAGTKTLRLLKRDGYRFVFEMAMGRPQYKESEVGCRLETTTGTREVTLLNVGNPQCVLLVGDFDFDWRSLGREIETLPRFPDRTNVSFVKIVDGNTIDVRFWERGAGETLSSGTGSTGAAVAAILSGNVKSPVRIQTLAGGMRLTWRDEAILEGPAEITGRGDYYGFSGSPGQPSERT